MWRRLNTSGMDCSGSGQTTLLKFKVFQRRFSKMLNRTTILKITALAGNKRRLARHVQIQIFWKNKHLDSALTRSVH